MSEAGTNVYKSLPFRAQINFENKLHYIGKFSDAVNAALAYDEAARFSFMENLLCLISRANARSDEEPTDVSGRCLRHIG